VAVATSLPTVKRIFTGSSWADAAQTNTAGNSAKAARRQREKDRGEDMRPILPPPECFD